jgi:putative transposase
MYAQGGHVVSTDEKTGIQANERAQPTRPMKPGLVERVEFEYIRHGTQTLIASTRIHPNPWSAWWPISVGVKRSEV